MSTWNKKNFSIYTSDERSALGLIEELGEQTNYNTELTEKNSENINALDKGKLSKEEFNSEMKNRKLDENGNFTGSWFGLTRPTLSDEGAWAQVELNKKQIETLNSETGNIKSNMATSYYVDNKLKTIVSGSPKGAYNDITALQSAFPNGSDGIYVTLDDGKWNYWDNQWKKGGTYQGAVLSEKSVNDVHLNAFNSPTSLNLLSDLIYNSNILNISGNLNLNTSLLNGVLNCTRLSDKTFGFVAFSLKQNLIFEVTNNSIWYMYSENNLIVNCIGLQGVDLGKRISVNMSNFEVSNLQPIETTEEVNSGDIITVNFLEQSEIYVVKNNVKKLLFTIPNCNRSGFLVGGKEGIIAKNIFDGKIDNYLNLKKYINDNKYSDIVWNTYGDSITYLNKYQPIVQEKLGIKEYNDLAWNGGRTIELLKMLRENNKPSHVASTLIGTNDFMMHMPLGNETDVTEGTFYGNLDVFCREHIDKYPQTKLFFMTPLQRYGYEFEGKITTMINDEGVHLKEYAQAVKKVANKYGFPVLDLYSESQFNPYNIKYKTYDGLHPSDIGYADISALIIDFFNKLI